MPTRALRSAASGLFAQQLNIEVISNNIANVNTTGFKKNKAEFQDLMYQEVAINPLANKEMVPNNETAQKIQIGNGVMPSSTGKDFKQGDIQASGGQLDMAIQGDGFFQVKKSDGTYAYTRDGSFKVDADGQICTSTGYLLDPSIKLDDNVLSVSIAKDGTIEAKVVGGDTVPLGNIELVKFVNPAGLDAIGNNLYTETKGSGAPITGTPGKDGFGDINQGYLEASNVDIVEEMISMITAQRAYEINSKTVKTVEDMMQMASELKK